MTGMCCSNGQVRAVGTGMMDWARYGQWTGRQDGKVGKLMQGRVEGKVEKGKRVGSRDSMGSGKRQWG